MSVVSAVLTKRCVSDECPHCGDPMMVMEGMELGTVWAVDLATRQVCQVTSAHGVSFECEMVKIADGDEWLPVEVLGLPRP